MRKVNVPVKWVWSIDPVHEPLLRTLFESSRLSTHLHEDSDHASISIRLPADRLPQIAHAAERITEPVPITEQSPAQRAGDCVDAVRTPDGIRTHVTGVRGRRPWPLDDGGLHVTDPVGPLGYQDSNLD